jgi:uncharacterized protein (DUF1697 family)
MRWVALLRAVNLGPRNKVPMAELRDLLSSLGYTDVRTLLQSGNAAFAAPARNAATVERAVAKGIADRFGLDIVVIALTEAGLASVVDATPFRDAPVKERHVAFLSARPAAAKVAALDPAAYAPDEFAVVDRAVHLRLPNGVQGSRLPDWERVLGVRATVRTWNTVTRLAELATARRP